MDKQAYAYKIIGLIAQRNNLPTTEGGNFKDEHAADQNLVNTEVALIKLVREIVGSKAQIGAVKNTCLSYGFKRKNAEQLDFSVCSALQGLGISCYLNKTGIGFNDTIAGLCFNYDSITTDFTKYNPIKDVFGF